MLRNASLSGIRVQRGHQNAVAVFRPSTWQKAGTRTPVSCRAEKGMNFR